MPKSHRSYPAEFRQGLIGHRRQVAPPGLDTPDLRAAGALLEELSR